MKTQKSIETKLTDEFKPVFLRVLNESHQHSVPKNSETHFRVELVSAEFESQSRIQRSRRVYSVLDQEMKSGVHALSLKLFTPLEWEASGEHAGAASPLCHGGSKMDSKTDS